MLPWVNTIAWKGFFYFLIGYSVRYKMWRAILLPKWGLAKMWFPLLRAQDIQFIGQVGSKNLHFNKHAQ